MENQGFTMSRKVFPGMLLNDTWKQQLITQIEMHVVSSGLSYVQSSETVSHEAHTEWPYTYILQLAQNIIGFVIFLKFNSSTS